METGSVWADAPSGRFTPFRAATVMERFFRERQRRLREALHYFRLL